MSVLIKRISKARWQNVIGLLALCALVVGLPFLRLVPESEASNPPIEDPCMLIEEPSYEGVDPIEADDIQYDPFSDPLDNGQQVGAQLFIVTWNPPAPQGLYEPKNSDEEEVFDGIAEPGAPVTRKYWIPRSAKNERKEIFFYSKKYKHPCTKEETDCENESRLLGFVILNGDRTPGGGDDDDDGLEDWPDGWPLPDPDRPLPPVSEIPPVEDEGPPPGSDAPTTVFKSDIEECVEYENPHKQTSVDLSDTERIEIVSENIRLSLKKHGFRPFIEEEDDVLEYSFYRNKTITGTFESAGEEDDEGAPESSVGGTVVYEVCPLTGQYVMKSVVGFPPTFTPSNGEADSATTWSGDKEVSWFHDPPNEVPDGPGVYTVTEELSELFTSEQLLAANQKYIHQFKGGGHYRRVVGQAEYLFSGKKSRISYGKTRYKIRVPKDLADEDGPVSVTWVEQFTPKDEDPDDDVEPEKQYIFKSVDITGEESAEYTIDPLKMEAPFNGEGRWSVYLLPVVVGVDNDRDGVLDLRSYTDKTSSHKPYRFWLNNDDDRGWGGDTYVANRDNPWTPSSVDNSDEEIGEVRDLDDFARIHLSVGSLEKSLVDGKISLGLKWTNIEEGDPAIRLFKAVESDGGTEYLSNVDTAVEQVEDDESFVGVVEAGNDLYFPISFWVSSNTGQNKYFIFEGLDEGEGELTIVLKTTEGETFEVGSIFLDILDIRKMYEQWGVDTNAVIPDPDVDPVTYVSNVDPVKFITNVFSSSEIMNDNRPNGKYHDFKPAWDEDLENKHYAICVHGWRKGGPAARSNSFGPQYFKGRSDEITMFKRLWHRGFKGRYIGFIWPTYDVEVGDQGGVNAILSAHQSKFNHSEYRAWKSGLAFKSMVDALPSDYEKKVFAHSLGNVVVSSALEKGMSIDSFALLNAAIPARCYHYNAPTPLAPGPIPVPGVQLVADDMSDDPKEWVREVSYRGNVAGNLARLEAVEGEITNFYLRDDEALGGTGWRLNQLLFKPVGSYEYENSAFLHEVQWDPVGSQKRVIWDTHEGMAMVNTSWSEAVGSAPVDSGAGGRGIDASVNLDGPGMSFGDEHEAVFKFQPAKTWKFYSILWNRLGIPGTATQ